MKLHLFVNTLDNDFCIKYKIIGIYFEINGFQIITGVGSESCVKFCELDSQHHIGKGSEDDIGIEFPARHATLKKIPSQHTGAKYRITLILH